MTSWRSTGRRHGVLPSNGRRCGVDAIINFWFCSLWIGRIQDIRARYVPSSANSGSVVMLCLEADTTTFMDRLVFVRSFKDSVSAHGRMAMFACSIFRVPLVLRADTISFHAYKHMRTLIESTDERTSEQQGFALGSHVYTIMSAFSSLQNPFPRGDGA